MVKLITNNQAVSMVVSFLLVVGIVVSTMLIILFWALPLIEEKKSENELQTIFYSFEIIDNTVEDLLMESTDAKRIVGVVCPNDQGLLELDSSTDKLIISFTYDINYGYDISGLDDEDDEFFLHLENPAPYFFTDIEVYYLKPEGDYTPPLWDTSSGFIVPIDLDTSKTENPKTATHTGVTPTDVSVDTDILDTGMYDLKGNYLIEFFDKNLPPPDDTKPLARIWVFELGCVTYKAYYSIGNQKTIFENGAIMSTGIRDKGIINNPALIITNDKESVALRVIQLHAVRSGSVGGRSTPKLEFNLKNSFKREQPINLAKNVFNLEFQIFGENEQVWLDYFLYMDEFDPVAGFPNTVNYNTNGINFILESSFVEIGIG